MKDTLLLRFYFTLHIPKVVLNDIDFFEASLKGTYRGKDIDDAYMVGGKKNGSRGRIRLVGRRMEAEVALKVLVYLISCRCNQILSMRLPFFNISPNTGWLSIAADPRLAYHTVEAFSDDTEAAMMRIRSVEKRVEAKVALKVLVYLNSFRCNQILSMRFYKERKSRVSQDGDVEL
jgi:hypothetical protein